MAGWGKNNLKKARVARLDALRGRLDRGRLAFQLDPSANWGYPDSVDSDQCLDSDFYRPAEPTTAPDVFWLTPLTMFLVDTNVIRVARKGHRANVGVIDFWAEAARNDTPLFLASVTVGALSRGGDLIRHRGDQPQAALLDELTVVTRYTDGFAPSGVRPLNPFKGA